MLDPRPRQLQQQEQQHLLLRHLYDFFFSKLGWLLETDGRKEEERRRETTTNQKMMMRAVVVVSLLLPTISGWKMSAVGVAKQLDGPRVVGGSVTKTDVPLMVQDKPWEPRIDNGYPNVHFDKGLWRLWYGDCVSEDGSCGSQIVCYAESEDGLTWRKPNLGVFDLDHLRPDLAIGKQNNIVLQGGGVGVYKHGNEFIAFGDFCVQDNTTTMMKERQRKSFSKTLSSPQCASGSRAANVATSHDGIIFKNGSSIDWPAPQAYDTHNNLFFDNNSTFTATTRLNVNGIREIGIATSANLYSFDTSKAPAQTLYGTELEQNYAQITMKWLDLYLGFVMVFDDEQTTKFGHGKVHCRLAYTEQPQHGWHLLPTDFIPLGTLNPNTFDSHEIFLAALPITHDHQGRLYYMGGNGPHNGDRNSSLSVAYLREDGFVAVKGTGAVETLALLVSQPTLRLTADVFSDQGYLRLKTVNGVNVNAQDITGNVTDAPIEGLDLSRCLNTSATFLFHLKDAAFYTLSMNEHR